MSTLPKQFITYEEYLAQERQAEYKSEYWHGEMFAMAGGSEPHNLISANILASLHSQLRGKGCRVYGSDMRVRVPSTDLTTYPDVVVACGASEYFGESRDTLQSPTVLVEVLSPSTESYDRGRKSEHYRTLTSLQQYLLVAQDRVHVELYSRQSDGGWLLTEANQLDSQLALSSIQCTLSLADIYEQVAFPPADSAAY